MERDGTERLEPDSGREIAELVAGGRTDEDLATMACAAHPRRDMHWEAHIARIGERRAAAVEPNPDADATPTGPGHRIHRLLNLDGGIEGVPGPGVGREELVGAGIDLVAAVGADRPSDQVPHSLEQRGIEVPELSDQPGRRFDVGEEQSDHPGRQVGRARLRGLP